MTDAPTITVFTAPDCGRCPDALERAEAVATDHGVSLERIDIETDRTKALQAGVLSVPTIVVGETQLTGVPERVDIVSALEKSQ